jgi:hypothetical protein
MADMAGSRQQLLEQDVHIGLRLERIVVAKLLAWQCVLLVSGNANAWLGAAHPPCRRGGFEQRRRDTRQEEETIGLEITKLRPPLVFVI